MKLIFYLVSIISILQARSVEANDEVYDDIIDTHVEVKQIEKDINQYENKVLTEARTIFHENEKMLLKETLEHESESADYNGKNKTAIDLCLTNVGTKFSAYKNVVDDYKVCLSKVEIKYYQVPIEDYKFILFKMSEILEAHVNSSVEECKYWEESSTINMTINDCFNAKRPGINAILYGLEKTSIKLQRLIYYAGEKLKSECKICASNQQLKLKTELFNINVKTNSCIQNN